MMLSDGCPKRRGFGETKCLKWFGGTGASLTLLIASGGHSFIGSTPPLAGPLGRPLEALVPWEVHPEAAPSYVQDSLYKDSRTGLPRKTYHL